MTELFVVMHCCDVDADGKVCHRLVTTSIKNTPVGGELSDVWLQTAGALGIKYRTCAGLWHPGGRAGALPFQVPGHLVPRHPPRPPCPGPFGPCQMCTLSSGAPTSKCPFGHFLISVLLPFICLQSVGTAHGNQTSCTETVERILPNVHFNVGHPDLKLCVW